MSWLDQVRTSPAVPQPLRIVLYGVEGVGKTTFAAGSKRPVFLGGEDGFGNLDVPRFPSPKSLGDFRGQLSDLVTGKHDFQTAVIDTIDWLETLVWDQVCKDDGASSIENVGGGFGKGYTEAVRLWVEIMDRDLAALRTRGMTVIALAHSHVKATKNPEGVDYDRFTLKLNDKASAKWKEWSDLLLFANFDVRVIAKDTKSDKALLTGRGKATGGTRRLYTTRAAAYDAKNRYSLPESLALSWADLDRMLPKNAAAEVETLAAKVEDLLGRVDLDAEKLAATRKLLVENRTNLKFLRTLCGKLEALPLRDGAPAAAEPTLPSVPPKAQSVPPEPAKSPAVADAPEAAPTAPSNPPASTSGPTGSPAARTISRISQLEESLGDQQVLDVRETAGVAPDADLTTLPAANLAAYHQALKSAAEAA